MYLKNIITNAFQKLAIGSCKSTGIEIVQERPPLSPTLSRKLSLRPNGQFLKHVRYILKCVISSVFLTGCTHRVANHAHTIREYQQGNFALAENDLSKAIEKEMPKQNYRRSSEATWMLLDRATTRFAMKKFQESVQDYELVLSAIDYYSKHLPLETVAQLAIEDGFEAYRLPSFEQGLARFYFALALFHLGDEQNARALLQQTENFNQTQKEQDKLFAENPIAKYLFAALLEREGDFSNAKILYRQANQLDFVPNRLLEQDKATLILICHQGAVPHKISAMAPASVASGALLESILKIYSIKPALSTLSGIPVPQLIDAPTPPDLQIVLNHIPQDFFLSYDIQTTAKEELKKALPAIAARSAARLLIRRAALGAFQRKNTALGQFVDMGVFIANLSTQADTRSWRTLPSRIDLMRFDLDPGNHLLKVNDRYYPLSLKKRGFCLINIFNLNSGEPIVLYPT